MSVRHKPCPFCGSRKRSIVDMSCELWGETIIVECVTCGAQGPYGRRHLSDRVPWKDETEAYIAWDKRA